MSSYPNNMLRKCSETWMYPKLIPFVTFLYDSKHNLLKFSSELIIFDPIATHEQGAISHLRRSPVSLNELTRDKLLKSWLYWQPLHIAVATRCDCNISWRPLCINYKTLNVVDDGAMWCSQKGSRVTVSTLKVIHFHHRTSCSALLLSHHSIWPKITFSSIHELILFKWFTAELHLKLVPVIT